MQQKNKAEKPMYSAEKPMYSAEKNRAGAPTKCTFLAKAVNKEVFLTGDT